MLTLIGDLQSDEYQAAKIIEAALEQLWPNISRRPKSEANVIIVSGCKVYGRDTTDIDVVLCISFKNAERFRPTQSINSTSGPMPEGRAVDLTTLIVAIEVKSQPADLVTFSGNNIFVNYRGTKTHNATRQNEKQLYALQEYLRDHAKLDSSPMVQRCVVMLGLDNVPITGGLPRAFSGRQFLTELCAVFPVDNWQGLYRMRGPTRQDMEKIFSTDIFREFTPSNLDRRRIELITAHASAEMPLADYLGKQFLRLRGRGGSGKTIMLLKAAWQASQDTGTRSIVLTYNQALAADIKRLLALLRVPSEADGGIRVETVMSFFLQWMSALGLLEDLQLFEDGEYQEGRYKEHLAVFNKMYTEGALTASDLSGLKENDPEKFSYDFVLVDEAHDWPEAEVHALKNLYDPTAIALADGVDQFVRGGYAQTWLKGIAQHHIKLVDLEVCLRLKSNLAIFANRIAESVGLTNWKLKPNPELSGGVIRLISNDTADYLESGIASIVNKTINDGNAEIDCLLCMPPDSQDDEKSVNSDQLISALVKSGFSVWDATNPKVRRSPPRDDKSLRVVKYASCRGLEGWSVVLLGIDDQWNAYYAQHLDRLMRENEIGDNQREAALCAWESLLIAFTRPIDNLTVTIRDPSSRCGKILLGLQESYPDSIRIGFD